jgi:AcrR family transcriptional regulator
VIEDIFTHEDVFSQEVLKNSSKLSTTARVRQSFNSEGGAGRWQWTVAGWTTDVGIGSFYNHFETKEELFQAAVDDALDAHGALLDRLTESLDDPAEAFAQSYRLTGRLQRRRPDLGRLLLNVGMKLLSSDIGLAPRALRDITAAARAGRFTIDDPERAVALAAATLSALGQLLEDHPERDDAATTDRMAEDLLHIYGLPADEAHEICRRPLPDLDALVPPDSAA